jgi:hypothetical protein
MSRKKYTKKQLREKLIRENKKFNRTLLVCFGLLLLGLILVFVLYTYWHDTQYTYRKYALYGKEVPKRVVCMSGNSLQYHESIIVEHENQTHYVCSHECHEHLINHYQEVAFTRDAYSGDTICKSNAIIGLKERGNPSVVYFENTQNFESYFKIVKRK